MISGGAHRLGKELSLAAARLGMNVAITYKSSAASAEATCSEIESLGRQSLAVRCDQSKPDQIQETVDAIIARFGRVDCLIK